jgi:hypothetical protein
LTIKQQMLSRVLGARAAPLFRQVCNRTLTIASLSSASRLGARLASVKLAFSTAPPSNAASASAAPEPEVVLPEHARNARTNPVLPDYLPLRDALYADRVSDYFVLPAHRDSIAEGYEHWKAGRLAQAEQALGNADDSDPSVIIALSQVFKQQGRMEEAKQVLLHFVDAHQDDSAAQLYCWAALRELGHEPDAATANQVLGVVFEKGGLLGTDVCAMFRDRRAYCITYGGRGGMSHFVARYPDYATGDEARSKREDDIKLYGDLEVQLAVDLKFLFFNQAAAPAVAQDAPIEHGPVGAPVSFPQAATDFQATRAAVIANRELGKLNDTQVPIRLSLLTPAGKRVLEGDVATLKAAKGALVPVVHAVSTVSHLMQAVRLLTHSSEDEPAAWPQPRPLVLSLHRLRRAGFDRTQPPASPLALPPFVRLQMEAKAFAAQQQRSTQQKPFQSPF